MKTFKFILFIIVVLLFAVGCGSTPTPAPPTPTPMPEAPAPDEAESPSQSGVADLPPAQRADYYQAKPEITIDTGKTYRAIIQTDKGDIVLSLDAQASPEHVNNFVFLSKDGFYDGLTFHRVEPGFVIQGGDPLGAGNGGPGYTVPGEFDLTHGEGALAMARLPDQVNPNRESSGSQFYITLAPTPFLDGQYSVFGQVEEGMDVVQSIAIGDKINRIVIEE
jgi:cyclophilin family peptidyl-prolyl cis-trans isomerase